MSTQNIDKLSSNILSILPMLYVGWSDSVLSPSEMKIIHGKIQDIPFLTEEEKKYLIHWSDPQNPPSDREFRQWNNALKKAAKEFSENEKISLVKMGLEIADNNVGFKNGERAQANDALHDLHGALGLSAESEKLLLNRLFPNGRALADENSKFDTAILKEVLDAPYTETKDRVRKLLRDPHFALKPEFDKDKYRIRILDQLKALCEQGLAGYAFPKEYGGHDRQGDHIAVFEMLGYGDPSLAIKFGVQIGLFGGAVYMLGTEKHHKKYVEKLHKGELLGCFAMTETGHGSDVKGLETTATYDHGTKEIVIHSPEYSSGKEYIGNAMHCSMAAVFAQLIVDGENHGVHTVLVPVRDENGQVLKGVKIEDCGYKLGLNGVDNGRLWFDNVRVPAENLLNRYGNITEEGVYESQIANPSKRFFTMLGALVVGRICVGLLGINASKTALTIALKYAYKRKQFTAKNGEEVRIIDYPTHQKRLFPLLAKTYAYNFALRDLAEKYKHATEEETREIETLAAGLKAKATWQTTQTIQECREACGGKGYLFENRFATLKADTDIYTTFEGDNTVLMQLVAKGLLTEFKQSFHNDGYRAVIKYLYRKAKHDVYELNPIFGRNADAEHLLDPKFHFHAFNYRKRKTLHTLSERMQKYLKRGTDAFEAFLRVQNHTIDLANAFIDQVTLQSFYNHVDKIEDPATKKAMTTLVQVYALETIHDNKGWYLESDYMEGNKTKAIRRMLSKLYQDIKPHALSFVDAFAIPDELVAAPIALKDWS